ncbi:MAG TPA: ABC transporter substrate-binding protein [Euzebyales bacterium]|nr:ABC transporter substrate-binding protein [Euzebyales bacterium]
MGPARSPWSRQAPSYAIDREAITEAAKFGAATVNQTAIPESSFRYYDYAPYSYDPDRARQLLDDAGVGDVSMGLSRSSFSPPCSHH